MDEKIEHKFECLKGVVEKIIFRNEDNGFSVLAIRHKDHRDLITVVGAISSIYIGEHIEAQGVWFNDSRYGLQFKSHCLRGLAPTSLEDIAKYLGSGMIKGVGPITARLLVSKFGESVFDVIEKDINAIARVKGIGRKRADFIHENWQKQKHIQEIMVFLNAHDIGPARCMKIYKLYGNETIKIVSENPYRLAREVGGIGFLSADRIAKSLGIGKDSLMRIRAGLNYVLDEALNDGHCGLPIELLFKRGESLLEVEEGLLKPALDAEIQDQFLIKDTIDGIDTIFLFRYYMYEKKIAGQLAALSDPMPLCHDIDTQKAIAWVENNLKIKLAQAQIEAVCAALNKKVVIITGGPGTGKTTIINAILRILSVKKLKVSLCAPTGRAAKRLSESTGVNASTIHRLLKYDPYAYKFVHSQDNPLECDLLVVDESSMVEVQLMYHLLKAVPLHSSVIFVGDIDQLPSVGPGQVLKDMIDSQIVHTVRLNKIFRQGHGSHITINAHLVNQGMFPKFEDRSGDFHFIEAQEPEEIPEKIFHIISNKLQAVHGLNPLTDVQVLCPMQRGSCGSKSLNLELQKILNSNTRYGIQRFGQIFALGDKVMQLSNNYDKEVFNGDMGFVVNLDSENQALQVDFEGRLVEYSFDELDELSVAYAITIHKSQGSEYPAVIIPISTQHFPMLQKKLLYTAITRGKKLVFLVGQKRAVAIALKNQKELNRFSKLREWLVSNHV